MSNKSSKNSSIAPTIGVQEPAQVLSVNKWKFIIWLFIITIVMLFASQTSAYLVRRAEGNWAEFEIPTIFWISTLVLIISSATMHLSLTAAKSNDNTNTNKTKTS